MTPSDDNLADAIRDAAEQAAREAREQQADRPTRAARQDDDGGKEARNRGDADEDTAHVNRRRRPRVDHDD
ncbi:MAG TPA: hypothetical protein VGE07_19035 [Herpetosiphonaceae bacterium]